MVYKERSNRRVSWAPGTSSPLPSAHHRRFRRPIANANIHDVILRRAELSAVLSTARKKKKKSLWNAAIKKLPAIFSQYHPTHDEIAMYIAEARSLKVPLGTLLLSEINHVIPASQRKRPRKKTRPASSAS